MKSIFKNILRFLYRLLPDSIFIRLQYHHKTGKKLNLKSPVLFNEKIQWLKLYNRNFEYSNLIDKYEVRNYVMRTIGEDYLIQNYGVWKNFKDIPFDSLPNQFILKSTHDSGGEIFCNDKQTFDIKKAEAFYKKRFTKNWYWHSREWAYKNIIPRIIAEKLMVDESGTELKDYKIFCFNGEPKIIQVDFNKMISRKRNFYSTEWEYQPFSLKYPTSPNDLIQKPQSLSMMLDLAKKLSNGIPHVRVDLYSIKDKIYFGEMTFYNYAGYELFDPPEWDNIFGNWLTLPPKKE